MQYATCENDGQLFILFFELSTNLRSQVVRASHAPFELESYDT